MPKFYPPIPTNFNDSTAEERVYHILKALPDRYQIFHSWKWIDGYSKKKRKKGEVDFIIYDPQFGILFLEVKGGGIRTDGYVWFQTDASETRKLKESPWEQADSGNNHLMKFLQKKERDAFIPCYTMVWFPDTNVNGIKTFPHEMLDFAVLGKEAMIGETNQRNHPILEVFRKYQEKWNYKPLIPAGLNERLPKLILPSLELVPIGNLALEESERLYLRLTQDQFKILEFIEELPRIAIQGGAGSGKTLIAREHARQMAKEKGKTLFLVFNAPLKDYLKNMTIEENLDIHTAASFLVQMGIKEDDISDGFAKLIDKVDSSESKFVYQNLVIDEAQDFKQEWLETLELLLPTDSMMTVFYDREQAIQNNHEGLPKWISVLDNKLTLTRNCRNTNEVAKTAFSFIGKDAPKMLKDNPGPMPKWLECTSVENYRDTITKLMQKLILEKIPPEEIALVTLGSSRNNSFADILGTNQFIRVDGQQPILFSDSKTQSRIFKASVRRFKGLEAQCLILIDPPFESNAEGDFDTYLRTFYTACSRAKRDLYMITKPLKDNVYWGEQGSMPALAFRKFFKETYFWE